MSKRVFDILFESVHSSIIGIIFFYIYIQGRKLSLNSSDGWRFIIAGFGLLFLGTLVDITDNFHELERFIIIGDTQYEAFIEKVLGYTLGSLLLAIGFWKFLPAVLQLRDSEKSLSERTRQLTDSEANLLKLNMRLEEKVAERTAGLESAGRELAALNQDLSQRSAALEEANRQLEAFTFTVSHDLRAPVRNTGSFAAMLLNEHSCGLDEEGLNLTRRIAAKCSQMEQLIDALLQLSRVASCPINKTRVKTDRVVAEILAELQVELDGRKHEIIVSPLPDCIADELLIRQVWVNLLDNAVKYTRNCATTRIEVSAVTGGGEITFTVRDNGSGFDMNYYDKLFGVFQRLHPAHEFSGTGVGLTIVQNIIRKHVGRIWAEASVGTGATFCFTLPVINEAVPPQDQSCREAAGDRG